MTRRQISAAVLALAAVVLLIALPKSSSAEFRHISLLRSAPAADTVLTQSPAEIRLWFSGVPREGTTSLQLLEVSEEPASVHLTDVAPNPDDATIQFSQLHGKIGRAHV